MYKALIVDDERLVREDLKIIIKEENLPLELIGEGKDGQEAFELININPPDIIITDVRMPVMDGITLMKNVKSLYRNTKFIIISGFSEFEYAREALELGAVGYVLKPIRNEDLARVIKKACSELDEVKNASRESERKKLLEKENLMLSIEKSLNSLLFDEDHDRDIYRRIAGEIPGLEDSCFVLGIFHIDHPKTYESCFNENDFNLVRFSVRNILEELCTGNKFLFNNFKDKMELLIMFYDSSECQVLRDTNSFIYDSYIKIRSLISISLTVGVSNPHNGLLQLTRCYEEAKYALDQRFAGGNNQIYKFQDVKALHRSGFRFPEFKIQTLGIYLEHLSPGDDLEDIERVIRDIFSTECLRYAISIHLKMIFVDIISMIKKLCERLGLNIIDFIDESAVSGEILEVFSNNRDVERYIRELVRKIMVSAKSVSMDTKSLIPRIEEYIKNHFHEDISLDTIAQVNQVSSKYLSRVFKNLKGKSFSDYLAEIRMKRAKELLETTQMGIQDIAASVGYPDHQYFHRVFKRHTGVTPNDYRMQNRIKGLNCRQGR